MEPEFLFPVATVCIGIACGVVLKRAGWGLLILLIIALCIAISYVLLFHSQLLGWEGIGPGMVVVIAIAPLGFGLLIAALGHAIYAAIGKRRSD